MLIKQISVFVENKPGRLADITKTLATNQVDIRALSIADTTDFGILRLIVNKPMMAAEVLRDAGYTVSITEVIGIGINDQPGGLCDALSTLLAAGITVEYMYAFIGRAQNTAYVILRVENTQAAIEALQEQGIQLIRGDDIYELVQ